MALSQPARRNNMRSIAVILTLCAFGWSLTILQLNSVQNRYSSLIKEIGQGKAVPPKTLHAAINDYHHAAPYFRCYDDFHRELSTLYMSRYAMQQAQYQLLKLDDSLAAAMDHLDQQVACRPHDSNSWLNRAIVQTHRAGFNQQALASYKQSVKHSPREAWLAERRSLFALRFYPLFDREAQQQAMVDITILQHASSNRRRKFLQRTGMESLDTLLQEMQQAQKRR
jgi:hypothetical protein